ncbi:MAG: hypothetical protein ACKVXR_15710 [Planctomycetota bacterium]
MESRSSPAVLLLLAGGGLFALGVLAGTWIGGELTPARAAEPAPQQTSGSEDLRALRELVEDLALELRSQRDLERPEPRALVATPPAESPRMSAREPIAQAPSSDALEEILARLERFERTQRELLSVDRIGTGLLQPAVPPGMAVRDYLQALKNCGQEDEVKRAHVLWDMQRIRDTYGMPDEEADRGDYIEWIYKLPTEGTQFDFHFTGGLVVEAH